MYIPKSPKELEVLNAPHTRVLFRLLQTVHDSDPEAFAKIKMFAHGMYVISKEADSSKSLKRLEKIYDIPFENMYDYYHDLLLHVVSVVIQQPEIIEEIYQQEGLEDYGA